MPEDSTNKIAVGRIGRSYGVFGWTHVQSYTDPPTNLFNYPVWQIKLRHGWQTLHFETGKRHNKGLIAKLKEIDSPEFAKTYANAEIYIDRDELPELESDQFYWHDLIGCQVINKEKTVIGTLHEILETGANDVLVVIDSNNQRCLIPDIESTILNIDIDQKTIQVDWEID